MMIYGKRRFENRNGSTGRAKKNEQIAMRDEKQCHERRKNEQHEKNGDSEETNPQKDSKRNGMNIKSKPKKKGLRKGNVIAVLKENENLWNKIGMKLMYTCRSFGQSYTNAKLEVPSKRQDHPKL